MDDKKVQEYVPGSCNIGKEEIAKRYRTGYTGLVGSAILIGFIEILNLAGPWRLLLGIPVAVALTGFLQARQRFCLAYGFAGVISMQGFRKLSRVSDPEFLREDRKTARSLVLKIAAGTVLITTIYYLIPRLLS